MRIVITGGIGSGKSTVFNYMKQLLPSYEFISIDEIVAQLYTSPEIQQELLAKFGVCDRKSISDKLFLEKSINIDDLMEIVDPIPRLLTKLLNAPNLIVEFPLYFEYDLTQSNSFYEFIDIVVSVISDNSINKIRVTTRDGISSEKYHNIIDKQVDNDYRLLNSTYTINNTTGLENLYSQTKTVVTDIKCKMAKNMRTGIVSGSFDPITLGHCHIISTALTIVDYVYVVISKNYTKKHMFDIWERERLVHASLEEYLPPEQFSRVIITILPERQATVSYAQENNIKLIFRGMRNTTDFDYEHNINLLQKKVAPTIESIYILTPRDKAEISSSSIKSNMYLDEWEIMVRDYVPKCVFNALGKQRNILYE